MKFPICAECYGSMKKYSHDTLSFRMFVLKNVYRAMAAHRTGRKPSGWHKVSDKSVKSVAEKLGNIKLAKLFIEAQFHAMPLEWCLEKFRKKYPPVSVCFSGNCWVRYKDYVERGIRDAT